VKFFFVRQKFPIVAPKQHPDRRTKKRVVNGRLSRSDEFLLTSIGNSLFDGLNGLFDGLSTIHNIENTRIVL